MTNPKIMLSSKNMLALIIIILLMIGAYYSFDIILLLFASFVIACAINPVVNKLENKMPRGLAVSLVLLVVLFAVILVFVPLIVISIKEASGLADNFASFFDNIDKFLKIQIFGKSISDFLTLESAKDAITQGAQKLIENSITAGKLIANFATSIFAIAIMVFYFATDEKKLKDKLIDFFPLEQKDKARNIIDNISTKVGNYVFAQGIAMVFVGAITTLGLLVLHNSHAFLLGFITCICDIIPVIGPAIAVGIGLVTSLQGGILCVIMTFLVYMFAQWAQNQLLRPIIFGRLLNMHPLMIIVALLISARFLGFLGIILSPAIACVICVLVDELYLNRINKKED